MWRAAQAEKGDALQEFLHKRFADPLQGVGELDHEGVIFGGEPEED